MRLTLFLISIFLVATGCNQERVRTPETAPQEEPPADIVLTVVTAGPQPDGSFKIVAEGTFEGKTSGLKVMIKPGGRLQASSSDDRKTGKGTSSLQVYDAPVTISSMGTESDQFLRQVAKLFEQPDKPRRMKPEIVFAGMTLGDDPHAMRSQRIDIKLFHPDPDHPDDDCEIYLNTDLPHSRLEINEKDPDYRACLMKVFSQ